MTFYTFLKDVNLRWNPLKYNNLTSVSIPSSDIWIPDIILFNSANGEYEVIKSNFGLQIFLEFSL